MVKINRPSHSYFINIHVSMYAFIMNNMNIQVPPNLNRGRLGDFIDAGINDWGGIFPVTIDYVNPEHSWPDVEISQELTLQKAHGLRARPARFIQNSWTNHWALFLMAWDLFL